MNLIDYLVDIRIMIRDAVESSDSVAVLEDSVIPYLDDLIRMHGDDD
jgi:hypothetical protein